jgi:hypothetical protein
MLFLKLGLFYQVSRDQMLITKDVSSTGADVSGKRREAHKILQA